MQKVKCIPKEIASPHARGVDQGILGDASWKPVGP